MFVLFSQFKRSTTAIFAILLVSMFAVACSSGPYGYGDPSSNNMLMPEELSHRGHIVNKHDHGIVLDEGECPTPEQLVQADKYMMTESVNPTLHMHTLNAEKFVEMFNELGPECTTYLMTGAKVEDRSDLSAYHVMDRICSGYNGLGRPDSLLAQVQLKNLSTAAYLKDPTLLFDGVQCDPDLYNSILYTSEYALWLQTDEGKEWALENFTGYSDDLRERTNNYLVHQMNQ